MTYHRINPVLWDDDKFIDLDDLTGKLWLLILTGPQVTSLPGLQRCDTHSLAKTLRRPVVSVAESLQKLSDLKMIRVDLSWGVFCIPSAPEHNPAASSYDIESWWKNWNKIPDCNLKFHHIENLKANACLDKPSHKDIWDRTFGTVEVGSVGAA